MIQRTLPDSVDSSDSVLEKWCSCAFPPPAESSSMSEPDLLFAVRNYFYLGAYQAAIAEASDLEGLTEAQKVERDCYVYRSYIELGSYEVRLHSNIFVACTCMQMPLGFCCPADLPLSSVAGSL